MCRAFNWIINNGKALYWATSQWTTEQIMEAFVCCDKLGLQKPIADQSEYNLFVRNRCEVELVPLYEKCKYGTTIWSPLAGGYLTGKYNGGNTPINSRYNESGWPKDIVDGLNLRYIGKNKEKFYKRLKELEELAKHLNCSQAQLSLAWCLANNDVSTAIMGASNIDQLKDNLGAIEVVKKWNPDIEKRIEGIMQNTPEPIMNWREFKPFPNRRDSSVTY